MQHYISEHLPDVPCFNRASTCRYKAGSTSEGYRCRYKLKNQASGSPKASTSRFWLWNPAAGTFRATFARIRATKEADYTTNTPWSKAE